MSKATKIVAAMTAVATAFTMLSGTTADAVPMARALRAFLPMAEAAKPPPAWASFCRRYANECNVKPTSPQDIELTDEVWESITGANRWVNAHIKPKIDKRHHGIEDRWDFAEDGYGDCEDYALLKRRILIEVGFPREALLITVVWTKQNTGHAVLMVRTDKGEYILDNMTSRVVLWSQTGYDFVKRQTQSNPNEWVYIDRPLKAPPPVVIARKNRPVQVASAEAAARDDAQKTMQPAVAQPETIHLFNAQIVLPNEPQPDLVAAATRDWQP